MANTADSGRETPESQDRIKSAIAALDQTIDRVAEDAKQYEVRAARQRNYHVIFRAVTAILGVAAPALVTYQTQVAGELFKLLAILLTGIAGAAATLQATFGWGESYGRTQLTALALRELESDMRMRKESALDTTDQMKKYSDVRGLNGSGYQRWQQIIRLQIETEVSIVTQAEGYKPLLTKDGSASTG